MTGTAVLPLTHWPLVVVTRNVLSLRLKCCFFPVHSPAESHNYGREWGKGCRETGNCQGEESLSR